MLHQAGGKTLIEHTVETALAMASPERMFVVVGHQADEVRERGASRGVRFIASDRTERHRPRADGGARACWQVSGGCWWSSTATAR